MIELADLKARVRRLDELTRGLAREVAIWKQADDPLLYLERRAYLKAIQDALAGVESRAWSWPGRERLEAERNGR